MNLAKNTNRSRSTQLGRQWVCDVIEVLDTSRGNPKFFISGRLAKLKEGEYWILQAHSKHWYIAVDEQ